jgi:Putative amidase domain
MRTVGVLALATVLALGLSGCATVHDVKPNGSITRSTNPQVLAQVAYAKAHYKSPNKAKFGDLGGTDCVNFTSQTLLARGWPMTSEWSFSIDSSGTHYSRPWISSTGFRDYLASHPELATPLDWSQRDQVSVGDVVQFDWDASGDRDHTAVVSGIETLAGKRVILLTSHSPAAFDWPIDQAIAEHGKPTKVYFWHLKN